MTVKPRIFRSRIWYFLISAQNIDYGYEYPQNMFKSRIKNNNVYTPVIPSFTIIKLGFMRVKVTKACNLDEDNNTNLSFDIPI